MRTVLHGGRQNEILEWFRGELSLALVSIRPRPEKTVVFRTASAELGV